MKKAEVIKNGNTILENIQSKGIIPSEETWETKNLKTLIKSKDIDHLEFTMAFYLWSMDNVSANPVTKKTYRLKDENFKEKRDLKYVVTYFEEKVWK